MNRSSRASFTPHRSFASSLASDVSMELQLLRPSDGSRIPQRTSFTSSHSRFRNMPRDNHVPFTYGNTNPPGRRRYYNRFFLPFISILLSIFAIYYAYEALINTRPLLGKLIFSPSTTVFVVNVLSQSVAFIMARVFSDIFETLRWDLASSTHGVTLTTFLGLSAGTSTFGVFSLLLARGDHRFWCAQRLLFSVLGIVMAVILTLSINYQRVYTTGATIPVFAGLTPVNATVISIIPTSLQYLYFAQWAYGLLGNLQFVTGIEPISCKGIECVSVFLPGGIDVVRLRTLNLNVTLLNGATLAKSSTVIINNAPGYQVEFVPIDPSYLFDPHNCSIYGEHRNDGFQLCIASENSSLLAGPLNLLFKLTQGWSICPTAQFTTGRCYEDLEWTHTLDQATAMKVFKRYSTVAYDRQNLSILSVESISPPQLTELSDSDYRTLFDSLFIPKPNATSIDIEMADALSYQIGLGLRLLQDEFRDDTYTPLSFLRGMLTIPVQFTVTAWQFVNATAYAFAPNTSDYSLPSDLEVTAAAANSTYRAMSTKRWTVYFFMGLVVYLAFCSNSFFAFMYTRRPIALNTSAFAEVDVSSKSAYPPAQLIRPVRDYSSALREAGVSDARTAEIVQALQRKTIRLVEMDGVLPNEKFFLLAVSSTDSLIETESFQSLSTRAIY